jgi:hypothetical protein
VKQVEALTRIVTRRDAEVHRAAICGELVLRTVDPLLKPAEEEHGQYPSMEAGGPAREWSAKVGQVTEIMMRDLDRA